MDQDVRRNLMSADQAQALVLEQLAHAAQQMVIAAAIGGETRGSTLSPLRSGCTCHSDGRTNDPIKTTSLQPAARASRRNLPI